LRFWQDILHDRARVAVETKLRSIHRVNNTHKQYSRGYTNTADTQPRVHQYSVGYTNTAQGTPIQPSPSNKMA
jgi:hypothetical protein